MHRNDFCKLDHGQHHGLCCDDKHSRIGSQINRSTT